MVKRCEEAGGMKIELSDYILKLWKDIGYVPADVELAAVFDEQTGGYFTPTKLVTEPGSYGGVSIGRFPKDTDPGDIVELLVTSGLPEQLINNVVTNTNGAVTINNLENSVCLTL